MADIKEAVFLDMGDLAAPKGSPPWCLAVREKAKIALNNAKATKEDVQVWVNALRDGDAYRALTDGQGQPFLDWWSFCAAAPPYGLGCTPEEIEAIIASRPGRREAVAEAAQQTSGETLPPHRPPKEVAESTTSQVDRARARGVSLDTQKKLDRLARDFPSLHAQVAAGELSCHRAAVQAGIVRLPSALDLLKRIWARANKEEKEGFIDWACAQGW